MEVVNQYQNQLHAARITVPLPFLNDDNILTATMSPVKGGIRAGSTRKRVPFSRDQAHMDCTLLSAWPGMHVAVASAVTVARSWLEHYGLWVLALGLFAETFVFTGFVIPGFALLVAASYLVADDTFPPLPILLAAWAGAACGDQGGYLIGYRWGNRLRLRRQSLVAHLRALLEQSGTWLLILYHYVPAYRTIFPAVVGSNCYPMRRWILFDTTGVIIWVGATLAPGFAAHATWGSESLLLRGLGALSFVIILLISWRIYRGLAHQVQA